MKHADIISKMTLQEKANFCSGKDFWHFADCERLGLTSIMVSDGPHGLRKHNDHKQKTDLLGSVPAICFPTAATTACSWDRELLYKLGETLGDECRKEQVSVLLGPGMNIKRSPLCGRNFEYFSEDPYLAGQVAAAFIKGVQSKGIGTSLKHFAANNQETRRLTIDTVADERTLREIYLAGFENAVKDAKPWTVMNAYNKINGTYCSENEWLLTDVLRKDWGYDGAVITDWGAENNIVDGIKAGQNVEMPSSNGLAPSKLVKAVQDGELDESILDERVDAVIDIILRAQDTLGNYDYGAKSHHEIARNIAAQSMVLLKNEEKVLPLKKSQKIALIGAMAKSPRYQGAGSSQINPIMTDNLFDVLLENNIGFVYSEGYDKTSENTNIGMLKDAVECAKHTDAAVVCIGLTDEFESEGYDRVHMGIPQSHIDLVNAVKKANPNTVVVLSGGAPIEMPWFDGVKGLLNAYLGGQASGSAVADLLFGNVNPSGKLAETYARSLEDTPAFNNFPGSRKTVEYRESIYVGYRYYDKTATDVLFPFGFGLSYTSFKYSALKLNKKSIKDTDTLSVSFKVKNTGDVAGAEIAQVYVADVESTIFRPEKELKGFEKIFLEPGEEKTVTITLDKRAFAYYNVNIHDWHVESGEFKIMVGASSRDIRLNASVNVTSSLPDAEIPDYSATAPCYYTGEVKAVADSAFEALLGHEIPSSKKDPNEPITILSSIEDADSTPIGKHINKLLRGVFHSMSKGNASTERMMTAMAVQIPIRSFISMSMGVFSEDMADGLCMILNGKGTLKGIGKMVSGIGNVVKNISTLLGSV